MCIYINTSLLYVQIAKKYNNLINKVTVHPFVTVFCTKYSYISKTAHSIHRFTTSHFIAFFFFFLRQQTTPSHT